MASVSYQLTPGTEATGANGVGFAEDAITTGTAAPTTGGSIELRVDLANTPTRKDIALVVYAFLRRIMGERYGPSDFGSI